MRAACDVKSSSPGRADSFTLVEMLVVMLIISILAALSLAAGFAVWGQGARARAKGEMQAMQSALEGYKADNGIYVQSDGVLLTNTYAASDGSASGDEYQLNSTSLYTNLSGQANYLTPPLPGTKAYMQFKVNQVGNNASTSGYSFVMDPWRHAYGYNSTNGATSTPYNGAGFYDIWTTGGISTGQLSGNAALTNTWLANWAF